MLKDMPNDYTITILSLSNQAFMCPNHAWPFLALFKLILRPQSQLEISGHA